MSWLKGLAIGLLGVIGGVLGNLIAAILQDSVGRFTPFQFIMMVSGIVLVVLLSVSIERLPVTAHANGG